jgi:hypothetical protein
VWHAWSTPRPLPPTGHKFDINCNPRPLGFIWAGPLKEEYINATHDRRRNILRELRDLTLGLLWFVQRDTAVPPQERLENQQYGLCKDEFTSSEEAHFPWQLYIREARRLVGRQLLTEADLIPVVPEGRPPLLPDAVAVGSFPIDSFPCTERMPAFNERSASTALEGYVGMYKNLVAPMTLPAGMMIPNASATGATSPPSNLIVPTAVSATHVAFSAVRLEPTWMSIGSAAGQLAHLAL